MPVITIGPKKLAAADNLLKAVCLTSHRYRHIACCSRLRVRHNDCLTEGCGASRHEQKRGSQILSTSLQIPSSPNIGDPIPGRVLASVLGTNLVG